MCILQWLSQGFCGFGWVVTDLAGHRRLLGSNLYLEEFLTDYLLELNELAPFIR